MTGTERGTREFSREVALRDPDWLLGDEVGTDYSLNPRENYGTLLTPGDYSPEGIVNRGNEWRDLWVHHALERPGIKPVVHGKQDIDMTINGGMVGGQEPRRTEIATRPRKRAQLH